MRINKIYFKSIDNLNLIGLLHTPEKEENIDTVLISVHGLSLIHIYFKYPELSQTDYKR